jgi:REP element-mobilizing transposase RayT
MSHTYTAHFVHCIFSTKDRHDTIPAALIERLWSYLGGIVRKIDCDRIAVGGTANHVHLLLALRPTTRLAEIMQKLKANSSRWLGEQGVNFEWQKGYGAFSVSPSMLEVVKKYIRNQAEHHRKRNFEEEFRTLLCKSGIVLEVDPFA